MHLENVNYAATGSAIINGAGATATATGWIGTVNEFVPPVMAAVAIISALVSVLTYFLKKRLVDAQIKTLRNHEKSLEPAGDPP